MRSVDGKEIEFTDIEFGVRHDDGKIYQAEDQADADFIALFTSGVKMVRTWHATAWEEVADG